MYLDKCKSSVELEYCVDMYMEQDTLNFLFADRMESLANLSMLAKTNFFRVIREEQKIVGWVLACKSKLALRPEVELSQQFYTSAFSGRKAVEAVLLAHRAMIVEAERLHLKYVASHSSHNDLKFTLCRILQKDGWDTCGYIANWRTSHHKQPSIALHNLLD